MDSFKDSIGKAFQERISSPLFGYISLTLIFFNWRPVLLLLMGKDSIIKRIEMIDSQPHYEWHFWFPLLIGTLIACLTPYFHLILQWVHVIASNINSRRQENDRKREYRAQEKLAKEKYAASYAERIQEARQQNRSAILELRKTKLESGLTEIKDKAHKMHEQFERDVKKHNEFNQYRKVMENMISEVVSKLAPIESAKNIEEARLIISSSQIEIEKLKKAIWIGQDGGYTFGMPSESDNQ